MRVPAKQQFSYNTMTKHDNNDRENDEDLPVHVPWHGVLHGHRGHLLQPELPHHAVHRVLLDKDVEDQRLPGELVLPVAKAQ